MDAPSDTAVSVPSAPAANQTLSQPGRKDLRQEPNTDRFAQFWRRQGANLVTGGRILLTPFVVYLLASDHIVAGGLLWAIACYSDRWDGQLARHLYAKYGPGYGITELGKVMDPYVDKLLIIWTLWTVRPPSYMFWSITALELALIFARPIRLWRLKRNGLVPKVQAAQRAGKWKMGMEITLVSAVMGEEFFGRVGAYVAENVNEVVALVTCYSIASIANPLMYSSFILSLFFGAGSLYSHLAIPKETGAATHSS